MSGTFALLGSQDACPLTRLGCLSFCRGPYRLSRFERECRIKPPWGGPFRMYPSELKQLHLPWAPYLTTDQRLLALAQLEEQKTVDVSPPEAMQRVRYLLRQEYFQREERRPPEWTEPPLLPPPPRKRRKPRPPAIDTEHAARNREIYLTYLEGDTAQQLAKRYYLSRQAIIQICANQKLDQARLLRRYLTGQRGLNLGRPIDMGGPRDVWLEFWPAERRHE